MYNGYRIVTVCPAGRQKFLEILVYYIIRNRHLIDEHHFWLNTNNKSDIDYIEWVSRRRNFKVIYPKVRVNGVLSIYQFFDYCVDQRTIYIRIDDDIVWMSGDALERLLDFRLNNKEYFLVFPHIINNSMNRFPGPFDHIGGNWFWSREHFVEKHNYFLDNIGDLDRFKIPNFNYPARLNINCISWFGEEFAKFNGKVDKQEEPWLTTTKPGSLGKVNGICGSSLMVHFSFYSQRNFPETGNILSRYKKLAQLGFI
jgi:hypothetical protein